MRVERMEHPWSFSCILQVARGDVQCFHAPCKGCCSRDVPTKVNVAVSDSMAFNKRSLIFLQDSSTSQSHGL